MNTVVFDLGNVLVDYNGVKYIQRSVSLEM